MKLIALVYMLSLDLLVCSCQCSNQDFKEYEGEYYGKIEKREVKIEKEQTSRLSPNIKGESVEFYTIGLPKMSDDIQELRIKRIAYTLSYNKTTLIPNWVAWHLTGEHTDGDIPRDNAYYEDESVPLPRATNEDYHESGWSRGHMCPAGDNKWDAETMRESNLLTNICPQHASLNSGLWNVIERDCRKWAKEFGSAYIVCGPVLLNEEHETIGKNKIVVPEAFFKVIPQYDGPVHR